MADETVDIQDPDYPGQKKTIPEADYDPAVHTLWSEPEVDEPAATPPMPMADVDPVPGPPMQDPMATASPESLPEQPNAAVIEAPGSKAAEMIQRARGQQPINMGGPRQDRAEQETLRAESVQASMGMTPVQTDEDRELRRQEYASSQAPHEDEIEASAGDGEDDDKDK